MNRYREELGDTVAFHYFLQFFFFRQWYALREYARQNGVTIIGDVPLYVAGNSVDVWANTGIFLLDRDLNPLKVAGVPPTISAPRDSYGVLPYMTGRASAGRNTTGGWRGSISTSGCSTRSESTISADWKPFGRYL